MPNTKAVGVAFSDPQFDSLTVTGATSLQATTATTVTASTNLVIAYATKGVILSAPVAGTVVIIKNVDVANAVLKVYPNSGAAINALTATTGAYSMAAKTSMILVAYSATQWYTLPLVAS